MSVVALLKGAAFAKCARTGWFGIVRERAADLAGVRVLSPLGAVAFGEYHGPVTEYVREANAGLVGTWGRCCRADDYDNGS